MIRGVTESTVEPVALATLHDALLPKLISGKLRMKQMEMETL